MKNQNISNLLKEYNQKCIVLYQKLGIDSCNDQFLVNIFFTRLKLLNINIKDINWAVVHNEFAKHYSKEWQPFQSTEKLNEKNDKINQAIELYNAKKEYDKKCMKLYCYYKLDTVKNEEQLENFIKQMEKIGILQKDINWNVIFIMFGFHKSQVVQRSLYDKFYNKLINSTNPPESTIDYINNKIFELDKVIFNLPLKEQLKIMSNGNELLDYDIIDHYLQDKNLTDEDLMTIFEDLDGKNCIELFLLKYISDPEKWLDFCRDRIGTVFDMLKLSILYNKLPSAKFFIQMNNKIPVPPDIEKIIKVAFAEERHVALKFTINKEEKSNIEYAFIVDTWPTPNFKENIDNHQPDFYRNESTNYKEVTILPDITKYYIDRFGAKSVRNLSFQNSITGCAIISTAICKILSEVPNEILVQCVKKYHPNPNINQNIIDFGKLDKIDNGKYRYILPHILTYCQSTQYARILCEINNINYDNLLTSSFSYKSSTSENFITIPLKEIIDLNIVENDNGSRYNVKPQNYRTLLKNNDLRPGSAMGIL